MKRQTIAVVSMILLMVFVSLIQPSMVRAESSFYILNSVRTIQPDFLEGNDVLEVTQIRLLSNLSENTELVNFYGEWGICLGYAVIADGVIYEFAEHASPYENYLGYCNQGIVLGYEPGTYYLAYENEYAELDCSGDVTYVSDPDSEIAVVLGLLMCQNPENSMGINGTIGGVTPQLQNSDNCIVAALANVLWYWRSHGYPSLTANFSQMKTNISYYFITYCGGYANNYVPAVSNMYIYSCDIHYHCNSSITWSPSFSSVTGEIDMGYPCMVGFSVNAPFYGGAHMTMCYGYLQSGNNMYVQLADGHSSSMVVRLWGSYNDCVISVRPYKS